MFTSVSYKTSDVLIFQYVDRVVYNVEFTSVSRGAFCSCLCRGCIHPDQAFWDRARTFLACDLLRHIWTNIIYQIKRISNLNNIINVKLNISVIWCKQFLKNLNRIGWLHSNYDFVVLYWIDCEHYEVSFNYHAHQYVQYGFAI